ncbi:uncharacterized protein BDR25DRAFT_342712 [Lindgomyces ingoldianus]|uniref:Uncharacterized protein n=1 Tax=Lindgomyces ingoldianus TaxID=673940 RepID=A0ACB6QV41_9PLEO|nr:uncharacterized protein BDR25DRAFT_342712 [Lindgomyces ingoldianus]KAF2470863.1 hypothetical protein BDR25DRAFT_342712 [Lindgomyces ingoldianus]
MPPRQLIPPPQGGDPADALGGGDATGPQRNDCAFENRDWTEDLPQTDHVRFFRTTDWSKSKLGPLTEWSPTLRLFTRMLFADSRAACLWWGPDLVAIYNEAYMPLSGQVHPKLMGSTFINAYPDLWDGIQPFFDRARATGVASDHSAASALMVERLGWREEAFFTGNFVPIGGGPTTLPEGFYNSLFEVTNQRLNDRRTTMLNRMASVPELTVDAIYRHIIASLETNGNDIPMAILYEADENPQSTILRLRGHIGLPSGHNLMVDEQDISSSEGLVPDCRRAGSNPLIMGYDNRFDAISWSGFKQPSKKIAVLPITSGSRVFGYLITGTNPCRPFDDACEQFLKDLGRMVSSVVSAAVNAEEARKCQQRLENDLAFSDTKLRHLIEHASVGMIHVSLDGEMIWANDHYYALSGRRADQHPHRGSFFDVYLDEDRGKADELWKNLLGGANHVTAELRLKRLYTSPIGDAEPAQLQVLAFPYRESGSLKSIMACATDISRLKWAETFQARLATEAREAKRQQEAFIDVVSHEMRNPLSAIVHCADSISSSLEECRSKLEEIPQPCLDSLAENVSAAQIIIQCANHQKRIIDDVLTLSKLDSMLLSVTPTATRPSKLINAIMKIFEAELKSNHVKYDVEPEPSIFELSIEYLYLDPSRVTQIFINLLTNAIKFVKLSTNPKISVRYGATLSDPRSMFPDDMFWATRGDKQDDVTNNKEWGMGETIYLTFLVKDSGIGLNGKEIHKIFERFRQANMRTHVKYGGSGLGLFISKELTEKQGGEIGVTSVLGEGSTFGFYVKTKRVQRRLQRLGEQFPQEHQGVLSEQLDVLLVEDNVINQQVLGKQLKKAGCVVEVANHGLEALDALDRKKFDVVLMDLEMPVLDGLSATKEIRKRLQEGRLVNPLPIIAVTANVRPEQIEAALAAGADRVMQKPFKAADLVHMMHGLVPQATMPIPEPSATIFNSPIKDFIT